MIFLSCLSGIQMVRIIGADPGRTLEQISAQGVILYDIHWEDNLTVCLRCHQKDRKIISATCRKQGDTVTFFGEKGLRQSATTVVSRPVLTAGILLLLAFTAFLPTRILFFAVEGNNYIPEHRILAAAEACGLGFGASRKNVRSEQLKNKLLEAIPELKWVGINTFGCRAVISVREQMITAGKTDSTGVSSMVAARDGRIISCTVTRGNGLCSPGQVVREGELLISGYTDCGICIQVTEAEGEVFAETRREIRTVTPMEQLQRCEIRNTRRRYGLIFGKKRINFWKGSGISPVTCGRMYEEYYITLPGGFRLPVCLTVETLTDWETEPYGISPEVIENAMQNYSRKLVYQTSIAGSILRENQKLSEENGCYLLESSFSCSEMIGRVITEEIGETNGKTN